MPGVPLSASTEALADQPSQFRDRLAATTYLKLVQNVSDMVLGGARLHSQAPGNFLRRAAAVDQFRDLQFAQSQRIGNDGPREIAEADAVVEGGGYLG